MRIRTTLPILFVLITAPTLSRADESCDSWFCEKENSDDTPKVGPDTVSKLKGEDVAVELADGSTVSGVLAEIALDHVTLAVGATKVTIAWPQVVAIHVNSSTKAPAPTPVPAPATPAAAAPAAKEDSPYEASDEAKDKDDVVAEAPKPAATLQPMTTQQPADVEPALPPERELGLFSVGARAKLVSAIEGAHFYNGSEQISDYVSGGVGYELSFGLRLTQSLFLRAAYEHAELFHGERNQSVDESPTSDAVGIGIRWLFGNAPDVRGIFEAGVGYRWLRVPYSANAAWDKSARRPGNGIATFEGAESLRLAIGTAFLVDDHARFELLLEGAVGHFSSVHDDHAEAGSRTFSDGSTETHGFLGISVGLELGP